MKLNRRLAAAVAVPALGLGVALAVTGTAGASVGPVQYTPAGQFSISGYYAHALNDTIDFSHLTSYAGSDGNHTIEQLPVTTFPVSTLHPVGGAAGIALCNQQTGKAAQVGLVNAGSGLVDIVYATGTLTTSNNGDKCQGGLVNPDGLNTGYEHFGVLVSGIPDNNTDALDILYDAHAAYSFKGHHHAAGTVTFAVTNLGAPGVSYQASVNIHGYNVVFNEADAGAIADTQHLVPLSGTPPYANSGVGGNLNADPQLLEGFSHTQADGNSVLPGGTEVHGSFYSNSAWTAFPVASSANGKTYLGPTVFSEDHFLELVGSPVT
jgi:hypothetical protein